MDREQKPGGTGVDDPQPVPFDELYRELRRIALARVRAHPHLPISATSLVHLAYEKLASQPSAASLPRERYLALMAQAMRWVLIDFARHEGRDKRGRGWRRVTLTELGARDARRSFSFDELMSLDAALHKLQELDDRQAQVVELRYFAGMSIDEVATSLGISPRAVSRDWTHARSWLNRELAGEAPP